MRVERGKGRAEAVGEKRERRVGMVGMGIGKGIGKGRGRNVSLGGFLL